MGLFDGKPVEEWELKKKRAQKPSQEAPKQEHISPGTRVKVLDMIGLVVYSGPTGKIKKTGWPKGSYDEYLDQLKAGLAPKFNKGVIVRLTGPLRFITVFSFNLEVM